MTRSTICSRFSFVILIHTSVKLVTLPAANAPQSASHFNPHEREARDHRRPSNSDPFYYFNPHEREARDRRQASSGLRPPILIHTSVKLVTACRSGVSRDGTILIHTSVKLVTQARSQLRKYPNILIHTSVKLVTWPRSMAEIRLSILIHTSVKLVTSAAFLYRGRWEF